MIGGPSVGMMIVACVRRTGGCWPSTMMAFFSTGAAASTAVAVNANKRVFIEWRVAHRPRQTSAAKLRDNRIMVDPDISMRIVWFVWWISWLAAAAWSDRAVKRPPRRSQIIYRVLAAVGAILLFGLYHHDISAELVLWRTPVPAAWGMIAAACAGLLFTWWARVHLGRLWSSSVGRKADHRVVDTGPYGIVRHPIYTGITLASLATAAMRGTAAAWLGAAVMTL